MTGKCRCVLFFFLSSIFLSLPPRTGILPVSLFSNFFGDRRDGCPKLAADFFAMREMNVSSSCLDQSCTHTGRWRGISDLKSPRLDQ